jgi:hypothetical protein
MLGAFIGQLIIIMAVIISAWVAFSQLRRMEYDFYVIYLNRLRYVHRVLGWKCWFKEFIPRPLQKVYPSLTVVEPYSRLNNPYVWLQRNRIYIGYALFILASVFLINELCEQMHSGYIFTKSFTSFIFNPIRSVSIAWIFYIQAKSADYWKFMYYEVRNSLGKEKIKNAELSREVNRLEKENSTLRAH